MKLLYILFDVFQCDSAHTADCTCKVFLDHIRRDTNCLKNLRSLIRLDGGNTHLGSNLYNTADHCMIIVIYCCIIVFLQHMAVDQFMNGLKGKVRVDGTCTVTK